MKETEAFKVTFESDMTIGYVDAKAELKFTFELGPSTKPKALYLYSRPLRNVASGAIQVSIALTRILEHLKSLQYEVVVIDE